VNRAIIRRWINEYLDGEIGLADKAELEQIMAENPEVRQEYRELRRLSLHLSSMPDGAVHPTRFRQRVLNALDEQERTFFTPQRAFAGAMLVTLLVVGITFGLMMYNQVVQPKFATSGENLVQASEQSYSLALDTRASAEDFFGRLLLETELGMADRTLLSAFASQTGVYEGAACRLEGGMNQAKFPRSLPTQVRIQATPRQALSLGNIAEGLTGLETKLVARDGNGTIIDFKDFIQYNGGDRSVYLVLTFK
jgi:hypothetical protein